MHVLLFKIKKEPKCWIKIVLKYTNISETHIVDRPFKRQKK